MERIIILVLELSGPAHPQDAHGDSLKPHACQWHSRLWLQFLWCLCHTLFLLTSTEAKVCFSPRKAPFLPPISFGSSFFWFHYIFCGPLWQHIVLSALTAPFPFMWPKEAANTSECQSSCKKERTATGLTDFMAGIRKGLFVGLFHVDSRGGPICNLNIGYEGAIPTRLCSTECRKIWCVSSRNNYWLRIIHSCSFFISVYLRTFCS